jgi:Uma2 family endonuclease
MTSVPKERLYLIYPESDGEPMADNTLQWDWISLIKLGLEAVFKDRADVFVAGDLLWYPVEGKPEIRTAPDVLVALGRPKGYRGSYMQWIENNIAPQVVFEVLSPGNRPGEMMRKFAFYQRYGVREYYIYDPDRNELQGYIRYDTNLSLEEIPKEDLKNWISPLLEVQFEWTPEFFQLYRPDNRPFLSYLELIQSGENTLEELRENRRLYNQIKTELRKEAQRAEQEAQRAEQEAERAEQEAQRAEQEAQRAEQEAQRAEQEAQRAEKLAQKLRALGIDPDS